MENVAGLETVEEGPSAAPLFSLEQFLGSTYKKTGKRVLSSAFFVVS